MVFSQIKMKFLSKVIVILIFIIGYGIFVDTDVMKDDFWLEYASEAMTKSKGYKREEAYAKKKEKGSFLFFYGDYWQE